MNTSRLNAGKSVTSSALKIICCLISLSLVQLVSAQSALAQDKDVLGQTVEIFAADDFKLSAQFISGSAMVGGVLLLHDCHHSVKDFQSLYSGLSQQGFFVLALDLRGFGASQSELYSHKNIRQQAGDIVSYQGQLAALMLHWKKDIYKAYQYLQSAMKNNQAISIVTNGCSSNQAIYLAQKAPVKSLVMLAPELSYGDKEQFKHLADMPIYLLSSKHQTQAMLNAQELFDWSGDKHSVLQIFKGNASSYYLLKNQPYLNENIATWLKSTIKN
jgi:esterase/lipase